MATGMAMRTAAGLAACSCLIIILQATGLPSPVPAPNSSRSPCSQQMTVELVGRYGSKRRLLGYDLRTTRLLGEATDNSSSPVQQSPVQQSPVQQSPDNSSSPVQQSPVQQSPVQQDNSSSPVQQGSSSSPHAGNQSFPNSGTYANEAPSSSKPSAIIQYGVPIVCSVVAFALAVALVLWWVGRSCPRTPRLGRPVTVRDEETPPANTNNTQPRDNWPKRLGRPVTVKDEETPPANTNNTQPRDNWPVTVRDEETPPANTNNTQPRDNWPKRLGWPVTVKDEETPPANTNNTQPRDNRPKQLTFSDIERITHNFSEQLGKGAFGEVYLGNMKGNQIAVKKLTHSAWNVPKDQFKKEMGILMEVKHKNLVKFLAYCDEGEDRFLCFEFLSGGSLDKLLYASKDNENKEAYVKGNDVLHDWGRRYFIIKEVCTGLHYLHVECNSEEKILHLDLRASNILIDQDGKVVKIADFGISRFLDADKAYIYITNEMECIGVRDYLPKECLTGQPKVSDKIDIYCYGMFLLEMVTGWCATDANFPGVPSFIEKAQNALGNGDVKGLLDHTLLRRLEDRSVPEVLKCIKIACACLNDDPNRRPDAKQIAQSLGS